jgi:hypothetical protein
MVITRFLRRGSNRTQRIERKELLFPGKTLGYVPREAGI